MCKRFFSLLRYERNLLAEENYDKERKMKAQDSYRRYLEGQMAQVCESRRESDRENRAFAESAQVAENARVNAERRRLAELNMRQSHILIG